MSVTFTDITDPISNATTTYAIIDNGNGSFTSMTKAQYDTLATESAIPQAPTA